MGKETVGTELRSKALGIIGLGSVGRQDDVKRNPTLHPVVAYESLRQHGDR